MGASGNTGPSTPRLSQGEFATSRRRPLLSRLPARLTVPLLLMAPMVIASAALIALFAIRGKATVRQLAMDNFAAMHEEITHRIDQMVSTPARVNRLNAAILAEGRLNLADLPSWHRLLFEQAQAFETISCLSWDGADGRHAWLARYPGSVQYWFGVNNDPAGRQVAERRCLPDGALAAEPIRTYRIDPRDFAPFQAGAAATEPVWSPSFEWINEDGSTMTFALAHVTPYRDSHGKLLGVLTAQFTLLDISRYLSTLPLAAEGQALVIDREGYLLADSGLHAVMDSDRRRIMAGASSDPGVVAATRHLTKVLGGLDRLGASYRGGMDFKGQTYLVTASPFEHPSGLRWVIVTLSPESAFTGELNEARRHGLVVALVVAAVTVVAGLLLAALAMRPLLRLVEHVRRVGAGDLEARLRLAYSPEFVQLSDEINRMTGDLQEHMRLRQSLALAEAVQKNLLPSRLPRVPGLDVIGYSRNCDQTGGDYYDFLEILGSSQGTLSVAIGDVMGHGVPAALLMATARGFLRSHCDVTGSPGALLSHVNRHLMGDGDMNAGRFMTMLLVTLDRPNSQTRWASAGHDPPIIYDPKEDRFLDLDGGGLPLGILEDVSYDEEHVTEPLGAGQVFLMSTDGLWETRNLAGELFGMDRVRQVMRRHAAQPVHDIMKNLEEELTAFRGAAPVVDDVTVVLVRVES
ncbi:MAG: SpoIIE family protein phosphatase [Phycisphaeraceae bacterium]